MSASVEVFKKYLNSVFIETGSQFGDGIQMALDAGFKEIYSIEANVDCFKHCVSRFYLRGVNFWLDDSANGLMDILYDIDSKCTFWLDAHNENDYPVLAELEAISQHPIKTHTILIDDIRMFPTDKNGLTEQKIKDRILQINPDYKFSYEDGYVKNDILVAKVE